VVELGLKEKRPKLLTYGFTDKYFGNEGGDYLENPKLPGLLANVCNKARVKSREAITSLPSHRVATSVIAVMAPTDAELKLAVEVEAAKLIDYSIAEAVLDWRVLKEEIKEVVASGRAKPKVKKILVTITRKDLIQKYVDIFKKAGFVLKTLETESYALTRSLVGKDQSAIGIIDIGAERTNITVVHCSTPILTRSISVGGFHLSKVIAEIMGLDINEAEETKKDISRLGGWDKDSIPQGVKNLLAPIISEARYSFDLFNKDEKKTIEKIILTGGSAFFPNLCEYFTKELGVKAFVGDPWARVVYHEDLKGVLSEIGPRFSVAIGLAMREIE